jgi:hypothetical protein
MQLSRQYLISTQHGKLLISMLFVLVLDDWFHNVDEKKKKTKPRPPPGVPHGLAIRIVQDNGPVTGA